jgi:hypothetical protein
VNETISAKSRWSVDPNGVELGFYSFSKLLMIRDLEPEAWGETAFVDHPLLRGLLTEGFADDPFPIQPDAPLDTLFAPGDLVQVVDADSSQTIVIETVRKERNVVVQGPPGTGKSQTIANIIAAAVHDGRSVLFVAEKMAALNVVHQRLQKVGLGPICLQLHSRNANKRLVLAEIDETLNQYSISPDTHSESERLKQLRDKLNSTDKRMHTPIGETGMTPFEALSHLVSAEAFAETIAPDLLREAATWSKGQYASISQAAAELAHTTSAAGPRIDHPYFGVQATTLQPAELARLSESLTTIENTASGLASYVEAIADYLGLQQVASVSLSESLQSILRIIGTIPADAADLADAIATQKVERALEASKVGVAWADLRAAHGSTYVDAAWDVSALPLRLALATGLSFFGKFKSSYRQASKILTTLVNGPLPKSAQERIALVDPLIMVEKAFQRLRAEDVEMGSILPSYWRGPQTDFVLLHCVSSALLQLASQPIVIRSDAAIEIARQGLAIEYVLELKQLSDAHVQAVHSVFPVLNINVRETFNVDEDEKIPLRELAAKAHTWRDAQSRFDEWRRLTVADARLRAHPAIALADGLAAGRITPASIKSLLACTFAETVWSKAIIAMPELAQFYGPTHDATVEEFRRLEANRRVTTVQAIRGRHAERMPRGGFGEMNIIRSEVRRKRGHMPIRKLMKTTGRTLQRIKPVFLMSPISVAQFLPPNSVEFDLLVIDEASQVRPEDALGLVVRAKQMVVVGDNKQLPPTSFFDRVIGDEEDADWEEPLDSLGPGAKATELESILALCEARGVKSAMLRWHYRSRHPSLIEVSNAEFYRRLIMPPAPLTERGSEGLVLRRVAGAYDRGGKRNNLIEAEAVANAVAAHARISPNLSLGVVTFSSAQRDAIEDLLEINRRNDEALDSLLQEGKVEDVFVKNLENVQGDERDVIFVSVGYGPRVAGARLDSMTFGPVSSEGGERRLNVLFTRARSRCEIFASFAAADIDLNRARGEGPRVLKRFLQYAESGVLEEQISKSEDADSPFEETVSDFIQGLGYKADKQVGSAGFKIDLAVRHPDQPGRYMLAVECDGATYHGGLWARERDRLRQEILENMGWSFHRIWSTDWFYRRGETSEKLKSALDTAKLKTATVRRAESESAAPPTRPDATPVPSAKTIATDLRMPAYTLATGIPIPREIEPHEVTVAEMARITRAIVNAEGPLHEEEVARRVTGLFGKSRTGSLISAATLRSLLTLKATSTLIEQDGFWMTPEQMHTPPVRDRSAAPITLQRADMVSRLEIRAAFGVVQRENGSMSKEEAAIAIARLLGFKRTGSDLKAAILSAIGA